MNTYLAHHGILGQKWGIRRYQNEDGTLTEAGKHRYQNNAKTMTETAKSGGRSATRAAAAAFIGSSAKSHFNKLASFAGKAARDADWEYISPYDQRVKSTQSYGTLEANRLDRLASATKESQLYSQMGDFVGQLGSVVAITSGVVAAGQLAYAAYLKHQNNKMEKLAKKE